jgi:hypothetical protein
MVSAEVRPETTIADKALTLALMDVALPSTEPKALITVDTTAERRLTRLSVDKCSIEVTLPAPPPINPLTVLILDSKEVTRPSVLV